MHRPATWCGVVPTQLISAMWCNYALAVWTGN